MAKYEDSTEFKALPDVIVFHFPIGKITLNEVLHVVKKAVSFLFKTRRRKEKKKIDPRKSNSKSEDLYGYLRKRQRPGGQGNVLKSESWTGRR